MQSDLDTLENKLAQLVQLIQRLRKENHQLRQDLAQALNEGRLCHDKVDNAKIRLERLLAQLPEEEI
jgi:cell division protein ZapB